MQSLQDKASEWSGVAASDAFAIDETNVFNDLGSAIKPFVDLSTNFYNRVYDDEEEWFRSIFAGSKKEDAIRNQYEFFVQRMGGPPLYSQRKGHPALIGRHRPFPVTHQAAERWLNHMQQALDVTPSIDPESKRKMMNFFRWRKYLMANNPKELMEEIQKLTITNEELIDTPALDESEITEAEENDLYNAAIDSQLQKDTLQAEVKKAAQVEPSDIPQLINEGEGGEIVSAWATSRNRSLTEEEKACLIQALLSETCNDPQDFDKILLGWNLRGEHNVRECRNLLDDFQEMMSVIIASHRDFSAKSDLFMEGVRSFVSKQVKPRSTEVCVIPVTKKPEGLSQEIGRSKEYNN